VKIKSVIIIGAGLAGLSMGCYAQMNGYHTRIFERHTRAGGVCTAWKRRGYTIDGCIHWLMGARTGSPFHRLYDEVGALEGNRLIPIEHYARFVDETSGQCLDMTADLDRLAGDMKALSPGDAKHINEFVGAARAFQGFPMDMGKPVELMGPLDSAKQMWRMRPWLKHFSRYGMSVAAFSLRFQSPFLRWALSGAFVPEMPTFFLLVLLGQLAAGELSMVEGGSLEFALAIVRRYRELGGQITYSAPVEEITVAGDKAVGIRLADGSEYHSDIVVSAADGYSTTYEMLGGRYVDAAISERYQNWALFRPLVMVSLGVAGEIVNGAADNAIRLRHPLVVAGRQVEDITCRVFGPELSLAPEGKTVVQAMFESDFDYWYDLQEHRDRYEGEKARVAREVIDRLEGQFPGISAGVEMIDVATPYTFWRYTRNHRGAYEGWLMTPEQTNKPLPKTLPGLRDFYMAGQWVEPGGGIPTVLSSGRQVVQILCRRDRKSFTAVPRLAALERPQVALYDERLSGRKDTTAMDK
jgi:phytoene dehydrogenase-like protein